MLSTCKRPSSVISIQLFACPPFLPASFLPYVAFRQFHLFSTLNFFFLPYFFLILSFFFNLSVSGEVPQDPVISTKTGHLFERRLIEKYLAAGGKCPISGMDLSETDLLPVQGTYVYSSDVLGNCSYKLILVDLYFSTSI